MCHQYNEETAETKYDGHTELNYQSLRAIEVEPEDGPNEELYYQHAALSLLSAYKPTIQIYVFSYVCLERKAILLWDLPMFSTVNCNCLCQN